MHTWKSLKVFISSTFKDLELERDRLAQIFRQLQERIFARRLHIIPFDLRWREQSQANLARWCVEMVAQSQYFVGILGYRYGWRPPVDAAGKANTARQSITEMEIRQALATIPKQRRFFCLADLGQYSREQLSSEQAEDIAAIEHLKQWLIAAGEKCFVYHDKQQVLDTVAGEIGRLLDLEYPADQQVALESYSRQQALQEIIDEKSRGFVGRSKYLQQLGDFCRQAAAGYLVVSAVAGTGKSALLAQFLKGRESYCADGAVIAHYMSMAGDNKSRRGIVLSLLEQLRQAGVLQQDVEMVPELQMLQLGEVLQTTSRQVVIAIDGLDEMDEEAQDLGWLPRQLASRVHIVMTTRPVAVANRCKELSPLTWLELPPLDAREIHELIDHYYKERQLAIQPEDKELLARRAAGNPLFLKVALDEMAAGGMAVGQLAETVEALFHQIIDRLQQRHGEKLIGDYLGVLAASHSGLAEAELHEIIGADQAAGDADDIVLTITAALANFIITREKLLTFFHLEFERSVKVLLGRSGMRLYHRRLAAYFAGKGYRYERALMELPRQLQWSEQYAELVRLFADLDFLASKANAGMVAELRHDLEAALESRAMPLPADLAVEVAPQVIVDKAMLGLLARTIDLDLHFLVRHPQCLFQSLWNRGFWHDSPQCQHHYQKSELPQPWHKQGGKLYLLAEHWRAQRRNSGDIWMRSLRPLPDRLDSPLHKVFRGHADAVTGIAVSHDGQLVSASYDKTMRLWNIAGGQCLQIFQGHQDFLSAVAISPDGHLLASASADKTIRIWERENGRCLKTLAVDKVPASICFTAGGRRIVSVGKDKLVRIWDVASGECLRLLRGHDNTINGVAVSADGRYIVSGSWDHTVQIWDADSGECLHVLSGHQDQVRCVCIGKDNQWLASGANDHTVKIWDMQGNCLRTLPHESIVFSLAASHDGSKLVSGAYSTLRVWEVASGRCRLNLRAHESSIFSLAVSDDDSQVFSCSSDKIIKMWDIAEEQREMVLQGHDQMVTYFRFRTQGDMAACCGRDSRVTLWDTGSGILRRSIEGHQETVRGVAFHSELLASAGDDKLIRVWNTATGELLFQLAGHEKLVSALAWSADGSRLVSGSRDGNIRVWDVADRRCLVGWKAHQEDVRCLFVSNDNALVASGGEDKNVCLWEVASGRRLQCCHGHQDAVVSVAIGADGKHLISCGRDNKICFWQIGDGTLVSSLPGSCHAEQWSADNSLYVVAHETETTLQDRAGREVAFIPACIRSAAINKGNVVGGFAGVYTCLWQMEKS